MKTYKVYNLNEENETAMKIYFMGYDYVESNGINLTLDLYNKVYEGETEDETTLDDLFRILNIGRKPEGFNGHSLSISDVIEMDGKFYYCDSFGWKEIALPAATEKKVGYIITSNGVEFIDSYKTREEAQAKADELNANYYQHRNWNVEEVELEEPMSE